MMDHMLSMYQAVQLLALGPCLFLIFFLFLTVRHTSQAIVPALFFASLACSFTLPLLKSFLVPDEIQLILLLGETLTPAMIFLLVIQCVTGVVPHWTQWLVLAIPLIGGSSLVYATVENDVNGCLWGSVCLKPVEYKQLYDIFSAALTLLLTVTVFRRIDPSARKTTVNARHTTALVFALVMLNNVLLALQLMKLGEYTGAISVDLAISVVRIGFIYLALTSMFRVFDRSFEIDMSRVPSLKSAEPTERERSLSQQVVVLMEQDNIYRDMNISREKLAKKLAVTEQLLSRAVNMCLGKSISVLLNEYRVREACKRLEVETTPITVIAFEVGFNSIPSFNRVFKQDTGLSPSAYRTKHSSRVL